MPMPVHDPGRGTTRRCLLGSTESPISEWHILHPRTHPRSTCSRSWGMHVEGEGEGGTRTHPQKREGLGGDVPRLQELASRRCGHDAQLPQLQQPRAELTCLDGGDAACWWGEECDWSQAPCNPACALKFKAQTTLPSGLHWESRHGVVLRACDTEDDVRTALCEHGNAETRASSILSAKP